MGRLDLEIRRGTFADAARVLFGESLLKSHPGIQAESIQVGVSLIFFKRDAVDILGAAIRKVRDRATLKVQAWLLAVFCQRRYRRARLAAIQVQAGARGRSARNRTAAMRRDRAAIRVQRVHRGSVARRDARHRLKAGLVVQRRLQSFLCRRRFVNMRLRATHLQRWLRGTVLKRRKQTRYRAATLLLQRRARGHLTRRRLWTIRRSLPKLVAAWRERMLKRLRKRLGDLDCMASCPQRHRLTKCIPGKTTRVPVHNCDACTRKSIRAPEEIYRCQPCNFDLCKNCVLKAPCELKAPCRLGELEAAIVVLMQRDQQLLQERQRLLRQHSALETNLQLLKVPFPSSLFVSFGCCEGRKAKRPMTPDNSPRFPSTNGAETVPRLQLSPEVCKR